MVNKKITKEKIENVKLNKKEINEIIIKLAQQGMPPTKIGQVLKDTYGIPSVKMTTGKKIKTILKENKIKLSIPEDLQNLMKKAEILKKHISINKQDKIAGRGLLITEAKIRKLAAYYKRKGILSKDWQY
ncbi:MAG: 30S ribosomal protein S15 [Candidatus Pacearchaeota archaeon]